MKTYLVRGVPASLQFDGWWMDGTLPPRPALPQTPARRGRHPMLAPGLLVALIALSDILIWQVTPGLSLALFGLVLLAAALWMTGGRGWGGLVLGAVAFLPVIEHVQALSLGFCALGVLLGGAWIALGGWPGISALIRAALRLLPYGFEQSAADLRGGAAGLSGRGDVAGLLRLAALSWALPLGIGLIFLSLFLQANPLLEAWFSLIGKVRFPTFGRILFWTGMALLCWPFLRLPRLRQRLTPAARVPRAGPRRLPAILNPGAMRNSLVLFNLLFALQTGADITYLWGGVALPEGMSYAEYAHRGAYPLLLTALMAIGFALVARPFAWGDRLMRAALLVWMAQTLLLVLSSLMRLELYIEVYGLTRLRLSAGIWMALVAASIGMVIWQILRNRTAGWLLMRGTMLALATLYACMFFSFDRAIAQYNLNHDVPLDEAYICGLGSAALPAIEAYSARQDLRLCLGDWIRQPQPPVLRDWREWGFRKARTLNSLNTYFAEGAPI